MILLVALVVTGFLIAGGSRDDIQSLLLWRPLSMMALAFALFWCGAEAWRVGRPLVIFAAAVLGLVVLHLLPLPPALWSMLPGREAIVDIYRDVGMGLPWQPISVAQTRTWNALFSLAAPLAALLLALSLQSHRHQMLARVILVVGLVSGGIGLLQAIGPVNGPLHFYRITNAGSAVGLFANRNHQAAFLACLFPLLAAYLSLYVGNRDKLLFQRPLVTGVGLFLIPLLLVTGSRAGLVMGVAGIALSFWVYVPPATVGRSGAVKVDHRAQLFGLGIGAVMMLMLSIVAARAPALNRLWQTDAADELRVQAFPVILDAVWRFLPFGSGIGSFVETYKLIEPEALLSANYFNHAHNDILEVALTAGLPGMALMVAGAVLAAMAVPRLHRARRAVAAAGERNSVPAVLGRAGFSILLVLALGSIADYPLRVPSLAILAAIAAAWTMRACSSSEKTG